MRVIASTPRTETSLVVRPGTAPPPAAVLRGIAGVGAREGRRSATTTEVTTDDTDETRGRRGGAMTLVETDDNYGGGDDNYPRVVVEMGPRDEGKTWLQPANIVVADRQE
jgi:hypothetical protein